MMTFLEGSFAVILMWVFGYSFFKSIQFLFELFYRATTINTYNEDEIYFSQLKDINYKDDLQIYLEKHPEHLFSFIPLFLKKHHMAEHLQLLCVQKGMLLKNVREFNDTINTCILQEKFNEKIWSDNLEYLREKFTDYQLYSYADSLEKFNFLNIKGVKVDAINDKGENYLFLAVRYLDKILLDKALLYIDINYRNFEGETVIFHAKNHISYLKEKGAKFDIKNRNRLYPLNNLIYILKYHQYVSLQTEPINREKIDYSLITDPKIYLCIIPVCDRSLYLAFKSFPVSEDLTNIVNNFLQKEKIRYTAADKTTIFDIMTFEQKQKYLPLIYDCLQNNN